MYGRGGYISVWIDGVGLSKGTEGMLSARKGGKGAIVNDNADVRVSSVESQIESD